MASAAARARARPPGGSTPNGTEYLVDRTRFDEAMRHSAARIGVACVEGHCDGWQESEHGCRLFVRPKGVRTFASELAFVVDARGRAGSINRASSVRGVATTALSRSWTAPRAPRGSALASFARGWCWLAAPEGASAFLQLFVSSGGNDLPLRDRLDPAYEARSRGSRGARLARRRDALLDGTRGRDVDPPGRHGPPRSLRVGDGAFAVDPSDRGVEAIATALAAAQ
jgi:hypothetical protein